MSWSGNERGSAKRKLIAWYDRNKRDMPWRRTSDPYRILLSEFMLQQTQVDTVIPYFERFTERFPDVEQLASANLDDVLKLWEGLGYYTRARNLHKAADAIVHDHNGKVPDTYEDLLELPGFGPYTSAAVASIAFDKPHAVLDGNVIRVLSRLHGINDPIDKPKTKAALQGLADEFLNASRPGDHNQAVMELGATVCRPRNPTCDCCPVESLCHAHMNGIVDQLPTRTKRKARPTRTYGTVIINHGGHVLISKRREEGLLGGLWEFANSEVSSNDGAKAVQASIASEYGIEIDSLVPFRTVKHAYTHFTAQVRAYTAEWVTGTPESSAHSSHEWVSAKDLESFAYSRIARKLVDALIKDEDAQTSLKLDAIKERPR